MKFKISKEEYAALTDSLKELYKEQDGAYALDVDVTQSSDYLALVANRDEVLDEKKEEEKKRLALEAATEQGHISQLEKDKEYDKVLQIKTQKFDDELAASKDVATKLQLQLEDTILNSAVDTLAMELAGDRAELIKPHIKARLVMKNVDGVQKLFVKDATGAASTMTTESLAEEFKKNDLYAPILSGRNSSGGGAGGEGGGGAGEFAEWEAHFKPESRNLTMQAKLLAENPEMHAKLSAKYSSLSRASMFRQVS